jgi:hypothetical protein
MSRRWLLSLLCLAVLFLSLAQLAQFTRARDELRVDETNSSILLEKNPAEVLLAVENPAVTIVTSKVQLEILDPHNVTVARTTEVQSIARGGQKLRLSLPFAFPSSGETARKQLLWYRLHYRLSPQDSPDETLADGIISLSEMTPDLFELRVAAAEMVREGRYRVRVQAVHPLTERPSANVRVDGKVTIDGDRDDQVELTGSASTDAKGRAFLDFELPSRFPKFPHRVWATGELRLTGKKGAIVVQTTGEVRVEQFARVLITTDKPLYQPGQLMHLRALMLTASNQALANYDTFFKICDPEGAVLYRTVVTTSRFGIASTDWAIPENTRLGDYRIWVGIDGGDEETSQQIRISRYELPNFKVNVDLDRKYYLPGQNATATVKADYLFGQPVLRGKVRVVRESDRRWNYREQKWEVDEDDERKGETNAAGSLQVQLDLKSAHEHLADSDYEPFKDVTYAAYITDPTTNRTEQRRFDVRVTKDPIHVYVLETYNWSYSSQLPVKFYVSTFYADGSPARCKVNVSFTDDADYDDTKKYVTTVTTNRYGLARISTRMPKEFDDTNTVDVVVSASDSSGRKGSATEELRFDDDPRVLVETDKTVYRPGEPINAVIRGNDQVTTVVVDLAGEGGLVRSERLKLRHGRASITFPFKPEFKSSLNVVAYPEGTTSRSTVAMRTVLYPYNSELNVNVRSSQDTYRPGENAELNFSVRSAADRSEESALGVVVMDQAVLERFRTDQEFGGGGFGFGDGLGQFLGLADNFAGVTMRDLQHLDTSRPISPDLDMLAAVLVRNRVNYLPAFYSDDDFEDDAAGVFADELKKQIKPLKDVLENEYLRSMEYPDNDAELRDVLSQRKIDFNKMRDPWGMPYHTGFSVEKQNYTLTFSSSGADKRYDTADDFFVDQVNWPYFHRTGLIIDRAVMRQHQVTGRFIRDAAALRDEVALDGLNLDQMRDRWNRPYHLEFDIEEGHFVLQIRSGGPDKQFSTDPRYLQDDFIIWKSAIDYFAQPREQISAALTENLSRTNTFPQSDQQLRQALGSLADTFNNLRDPWGNAYYATFGTRFVYTDRVRLENRAKFGDAPMQRTNITPVTQTLGIVVLHSNGPDARKGTIDDFVIGTFTGLISEQPRGAPAPIVPISAVVLSGNNGAIAGIVTDAIGAMVPGATVHAKRLPEMQDYETSTNDSGKYGFLSLPPGTYNLNFVAPGFNLTVIDQVLVRPHNITEVNVSLQVGMVSETVTITSEPAKIETQITAMSSSRDPRITLVTKSGSEQVSTPRVREYFPETLLWQPSIETNKQGRARVSFKLADNITTWKMLVIGSTTDGRIGTAEKEIKAFQPFFVEHDPPRVLTEGDQISLPVVVRNYLSQPQKVDLEIKPESWFSLLGPAQKQTSVVAGDATPETFDFRVIASVKDGKQRITARGANDNDAIEKPVSVHPDGEEVSVTAGDVLDDGTPLELDIAQAMVPNSSRGELKIYPNLLTHVVEGVEAIMGRPHGCGEQTISSTYPSLLLLRHSKKTGEGFPLSALAQRYLRDGYSRLLNYRAENGGFTYWGEGVPDLALTAYALQFLADATEVTSVDQDVLENARDWLVEQQRPDGSWRRDNSNDRAATAADVLLSAYVTRVLARTDSKVSDSLKRALEFLGQASQQIDEPYLLASYALAAIEAKDIERAKPVVEKLRTLALAEGNTTYWALEANTPFHGWGLAGRVETTALAVQALAGNCNAQRLGCVDKKLINSGLLFLLKQKDPYGVWYSTQATVNVLDAMLTLFSQNRPGTAAGQTSADVVVNGNRVQTLQINDRFNNPITVDISPFLKVGKNRIEIKRQQGLPFASVQAVAKYYVPWFEVKPANASSKPDLRLNVKFDKTEAKINDEITCRVEAARIGFRGYGMLLAEIGIPPGAEVDRNSLQAAMQKEGIKQYDVLPDRVVVYLWPTANVASFNFTFRPRFGMNAKSAASTIYDYYNPEAAVVVPPSVFKIR